MLMPLKWNALAQVLFPFFAWRFIGATASGLTGEALRLWYPPQTF